MTYCGRKMVLTMGTTFKLHKDEVLATICRHHFSANNAHVSLQRIKKFVDDDGNGNLRLLTPGLKKTEQLMSKA